MTRANPYISPTTSENAANADRRPPPPRGLGSHVVFGLWAGILFGGSSGAGGAALLGLLTCGTVGWQVLQIQSMEQLVMTEIVAAIVGAICGVASGSLVGPLLALLDFQTQRMFAKSSAASTLIAAMSLSASVGAIIGYVAARSLAAYAETHALALLFLGVTMGGLAGSWGGWALGRGLLEFRRERDHHAIGDNARTPSDPNNQDR